jgi:hypothetical protein
MHEISTCILIMKEIQNGSPGNCYCTADVGMAVIMEELGAISKCLIYIYIC